MWACCCCKARFAWPCWAWICWFWMSYCCLSRAFLSFFCSCESSDLNSQSYSSFSQKNPNHFSTKPPILFLSPVLLSSCLLRSHVSPNPSIIFFSYVLSFLFFVFDVRLSFWVSASVLRSLSSNLSLRSSKGCCYLWLLVLLLTYTFSWR